MTLGTVKAQAASPWSAWLYDQVFQDYTAAGGTVVLTKAGTVLLAAVLIAGATYVAWRA